MSDLRDKRSELITPCDVLPQATQLSSRELFRDSNTVRIDHAGQTYWLRLTRGNKLILTK